MLWPLLFFGHREKATRAPQITTVRDLCHRDGPGRSASSKHRNIDPAARRKSCGSQPEENVFW